MDRTKRECDRVVGGWYRYFLEHSSKMVFNDEIVRKLDMWLFSVWGDFFERNLQFKKGSLLALGAGYGRVEIPLARRGYNVIALDNDPDVLCILADNAAKYAKGRMKICQGDLYDNFHLDFVDKDIQACVSFGLLEHFTSPDLKEILKKQFLIAPLLIALVPVKTEATLKTFGAEKKPEDNIDKYGIYRNFWPVDFWEKEVFKGCEVVDELCYCQDETRGHIDGVTLAMREKK